MRIVSYNIHKAVGLDGQRHPGRVLEVINRLDADVVLLQEADRRLGERPAALPHRLVETASDYDILPVAQNDVSLGWHGNAMLVRRGLQVSGVERIALPGLEPRGAILAEVTGPDGQDIRVVGAHLALLRRWRRKQIRAIKAQLGAARLSNSVIAGDFNEWSRTTGLGHLGRSHTIVAPGRSFHARRPVASLDRIAYGADFELRDAGVEDTGPARVSSDHLPVWVDLDSASARGG